MPVDTPDEYAYSRANPQEGAGRLSTIGLVFVRGRIDAGRVHLSAVHASSQARHTRMPAFLRDLRSQRVSALSPPGGISR
jgi:hypothetical protein